MADRRLTPNEALAKAAKLVKAGRHEDAKALYRDVLAVRPENKKAKKGLKSLESVSSVGLTSEDFKAVTRLLEAGEISAAQSSIKRLCKSYPDQPALHNLRGVVLSRSNKKDEAIAAFKEAYRLEPAYSEALRNYAITLAAVSRFKEALPAFQELVNRGHADDTSYLSLAKALRGEGQLDAAMQALRRALGLRPAFPDALYERASLLEERGELKQSLDEYQAVIALSPKHADALLGVARLCNKQERFAEAIAAYQRLLAIHPNHIAGLEGMAALLITSGRPADAMAAYQKLIKLRPDHAVAQHMLAATGGGLSTPSTSARYAEAFFNDYASQFESLSTTKNQYKFPESLPGRLEKLDGKDAWYEQALDLGCGTGLVGAQIRTHCAQLTGVDVSSEMIARAEEKAVYDELLTDDVIAMLKSGDSQWNLVIAAELLNYIGGLETFFNALANRCSAGARIILTTESADVDRYALKPSGRYVHSDDYVASAVGESFQVTQRDSVVLRKESGQPVEGSVFTLTRV